MVTKTLLPAMQTAQVEAKVAEKTGDEIDTQATSDLALAIDHLRSQMENSGKQYELFLLLVALKELTFDPSKKSFDVLLTEYKLRQFIQRMKDIWKEFESFRGTGDMELQAFLIQILVSSMSSIENPLHKEQQFTEALEIIQNLLTPQVNLVILLFANKTPYDWEKLSTTLRELEHGNQKNLYSQAKAKAYNSLEHKYYELTGTVDADIMEWLNTTAIMRLERCQTNEELESCCRKLLTELEIEVSSLHEDALEKLQEFFEKSDLREIIIQWQAEKKESLNNDLKGFCNQTKQDILDKKDILCIDPLQKTTQRKLEKEILVKANKFADQMKGKDATDDELLASFNSVWIQWLSELGTRIETKPVSIETVVEKILRQHLSKNSVVLRDELKRNPLSEPLHQDMLEGSIKSSQIEKSHVSVRTYFQNLKGFVTGYDYRKSTIQVINVILCKVDVYLDNICEQDSKFHESHATYVIKSVVDGIQEHNTQCTTECPFTLLPKLLVKLAVHACRHALVVFNKMQRDYDENHGTAKKLDRYKTTAWNLIKNMVNRSTKEVIAADLLCDKLEELANKTVKRNVRGKVQHDIRSSLAHLKHSLMINILDDLAQKGSFQNYMLLVTNANNYALKWITEFTNDRWFSSKHGGRSLYASHAEKIIHKIRESIEKSIGVATEKQLPKGCIKTWGKEFCGALTELPLKEEDLKHMMEQDVEDFGNLERILMDRLLALEERILSPFTRETAETIKWGERKTPYTQIIDKLWGCEAQCPFCTEPCERTDPSHATKGINHQCIQHRPPGVIGTLWATSKSLVIESCNYQVQNKGTTFSCGACRFECRKSGHCTTKGKDKVHHNYIEYKTYLPEWDISPSPNMESSK